MKTNKRLNMDQYIITLNDISKRDFLLELLHQFSFIDKVEEIKLTDEQEEFVADLKSGLNDVDLYLAGKKKLKTAKELLNEL